MKLITFPVYHNDRSYVFERYTGLLLEKENNDNLKQTTFPGIKVRRALNHISKPYTLRKGGQISSVINIPNTAIRLYARLLTKLCKLTFSLARLSAIYNLRVFENATDAIVAFRKIFPDSMQQDLCMPRTLFAASTSRKFKERGVIFIGVFLPSKSMHAWIIEDRTQPDPYDNLWIKFQLVAAMR